MSTLTGIDVLKNGLDGLNRNLRWAVFANAASVDNELRYTPCVLKELGYNIKYVLTPEHGFFQTREYMEAVDSREFLCSIPTKSLYGSSYEDLFLPSDIIDEIDGVIIDLQDVGARCYTYIPHTVLLMKQLNNMDKPFVILDRPNPVSGVVEGPILQEKYESFVGMLPVPFRHGMTIGESALFTKDLFRLQIDLQVIEMKGWKRYMYWEDTGLPFVPPSPNIPDVDTAVVYPGMVFFEGTNVSEGRGTTRPFLLFGAPFIENEVLTGLLNGLNIPGVIFRPIEFVPKWGKHANRVCSGAFLHVTDRSLFRPFRTMLRLLAVLRDRYGDFQYISGPYEFDPRPPYHLLAADDMVIAYLDKKVDFYETDHYLQKVEQDFKEAINGYLLYR